MSQKDRQGPVPMVLVIEMAKNGDLNMQIHTSPECTPGDVFYTLVYSIRKLATAQNCDPTCVFQAAIDTEKLMASEHQAMSEPEGTCYPSGGGNA